MILQSEDYEEEFVKEMLGTIINSRLKQENEEKERDREREGKEREREREEKEREEKERDREREEKEREFQLEKLRIETSTRLNMGGVDQNVMEMNRTRGNNYELQKLMHKFDPKEGDISLYLVIFERQANRAKILNEDWVSHLIGLLPCEIIELIAREPEEAANDYNYVKSLLLKRFKLSPDKFRQKFERHQRAMSSTWRDFSFELTNYFEEWTAGLGVTDYEKLKELMIVDQVKRRIPNDVREHFIDDWSSIVSINKLADKLDEYENVRDRRIITDYRNSKFAGLNDKTRTNTSVSYDPYPFNRRINTETRVKRLIGTGTESFDKPSREKLDSVPMNYAPGSRRFVHQNTHTTRDKTKCFNCNNYGHISKDCTKPKSVVICKNCGESGHFPKYCPTRQEKNSINHCSATNNNCTDQSLTYLKPAKINNKEEISALIDTGSSSCLLKESAAKKLALKIIPEKDDLYGFGNQNIPAAKTIGKIIADIEIENISGEAITILVVPDDTQPVDLIVGRTWTDLSYIAFARLGNYLHIGYADQEPFRNLQFKTNDTRIKLNTSQETLIKMNTINLVKTKTDSINNGLVLIKSLDKQFDQLIEVLEGEALVPIVNSMDIDITLKRNQCVARAEEVDICFRNENEIRETSLTNRVASEKQSEAERNVNLANNYQNQIFTINNEHKRLITVDDIKIDNDITFAQQYELLQLLNKFRDCFALNMSELGCTDLITMNIKEVDGSKPVSLKPYKTNAEERATIRSIIKEWRDYGIISDTRSPYASPVLLVKKKTGEYRLVVDFRRLNAQTVKDKFPLPRIDDLLECLNNAELFTTLDLAHGYLQIPLSEDAKLKTAFITPEETGQFERMTFGLSNAPSEFQRLMNHALGPLINSKVLCYLDDILIPAKTWSEMLSKLSEVFEALKAAKLTLKISKCEFGKRRVEYLGFEITSKGCQPGPRKIQSIAEFPTPLNVHEIRRFLGLTSFFRRFIPKYAEKAEPLSRLTRKDVKFEWTIEQEESFKTLKDQLMVKPILALYQPDAKTEVHTDASSKGIAGLLLQLGNDNKWHLVYCVSKKTTEVEQNYHSSKLELMAIVWTLDRLRQFLIGIKFTVVTDCQSLIYMNTKKSMNPQIARWCNLIQEYDFDVRHKPGQQMAHVDAISRAPISDSEDTLDQIIENNLNVCLTLTADEQILMIQHADPQLRAIIAILKKNLSERTQVEKQIVENYALKDNRLFRAVKDQNQAKLLYVIPRSMRKSLVVKFHDLMGHFATDRTISKIKELYWFPSMKRYVRKHVSMCFECLVNKVPSGKQQGLLHPIKPGTRPFAIVHMDHLGPFVKSSRRNQELLVIIDNLTRFVRLYPVKDTSAKQVLKSLKDFVNDFGLPERIISDRGSCFTSRQFEEYCQENGIFHTLNSTRHPRANGMVERVNRTILPVITSYMTDQRHKDWDLRMKEVERNLNNMVNKTTDKTPFQMLHGYHPRFNDGILRILTDETANTWCEPEKLQKNAKQIIQEKQRKMKNIFDRKKCGTLTFEPGEIVVVRRPAKSIGEPTKTQPKYRGPLVITDVLPSDTYRIAQLEENKRGRFYSTTAHVSQLKAWHCQAESSDDVSSCSEEDK